MAEKLKTKSLKMVKS